MQSQSLIKSWRARGGPYDGWEDLMYVVGVVWACSLGVGILRAWFSFACVLVSLQKVSQDSVAQALLGCAGDFLCLEACDFVYFCALPFCSSHCVWLSMARQQSVARALLGYARGSGAGVGV